MDTQLIACPCSPDPLTSEQRIVETCILQLLQNQMPEAEYEVLSRTARLAAENLDIFRTSFVRATKKSSQVCLGFAQKGPWLFFHGKEFIGSGHFKITLASSAFHAAYREVEQIIRQKIKPKMRRQTVIDMTLREVRLQQSFNHPNIVVIYSFNHYGTAENPKLAIYAEKCESDLEHAIEKDTLNGSDKKNIVLGVADALCYIHAKGLCHNDIKPDNIMLKGKIGKLSDFGFCFPAGKNGDYSNPFAGCKKIIPPEQRNQEFQCPRKETDVYQFGLTLWHLYHPNPPTEHLEKSFVYPVDMFENWPTKSKADEKMQALISSCIQDDPSERPTMEMVKSILSDL